VPQLVKKYGSLLFLQQPDLVLIMSQINLGHAFLSYSFDNHLIKIFVPSVRRFSKLPLSLRFPHQTLHAPLVSAIRATCLACLILLDLITQIIFTSITNHEAVHYTVFSSLLLLPSARSQIHSAAPRFRTNSACVLSLLLEIIKTTGKSIVLYVLIFIFIGRKQQTKDSGWNGRRYFLIYYSPNLLMHVVLIC
jgi:hypothetical protein